MSDFIPAWFEDDTVWGLLQKEFGQDVSPESVSFCHLDIAAWNVTYELAPHSGIWNDCTLEHLWLGDHWGYWCVGYAEDITTLFYRRYRG